MTTELRLIYDVGLHDGNDTAYYLGLGFHVVAIEANPALAHAAARRFARQTASGRLQIVNVGIAATSGVARFWVCDDHSDWSSFDRAFASRNGSAHHAIEIPTTSFAVSTSASIACSSEAVRSIRRPVTSCSA